MLFNEYDVVEVVKLLSSERYVHGSGDDIQPKVGDVGAIVHRYNESNFMVECIRTVDRIKGMTAWIADFHSSELKVIIPYKK